MTDAFRSKLNRFQLVCLVIGVLGLVASAIGWFVDPKQFFFSYLFAVLFWLGLSLGCFIVDMIHQLAGGRWGYPTRRFLEAGFMVFPLMAVLFIPIFFGLHHLYPWADPAKLAAEPALRERHAYENDWAYIVRQVFYFFVWIWMAFSLRKYSLAQDRTADAAPTRKARFLSGPGTVIYGLLVTFASIDWIVSLEKDWYSTMFGVIVGGGQILVALAFVVVLLTVFRRQEPFAATVEKVHYHHLGNLLLTFVLFWTYVSFGQLLIIYSGDLPHELDWYRHRIGGDWRAVVGAIALFHFFLPFFLLLFRGVKKRVAAITTLSVLLFVVHIVDTYWLVMPTLHQNGISLHWLDFAAPIGVGGLWMSYFLWQLKSAPLLPLNDPGMQFAFVYVKP
ncbi:MAG TPA: hypothetical protein VN873_05875 [Candidatus Angelobacter sp.]|nr:hypothetical protein [Candidatus Angelobacter sp.]